MELVIGCLELSQKLKENIKAIFLFIFYGHYTVISVVINKC